MTVADHDAGASEAQASEIGESNTQVGKSQPISQHPLFPAIVALWFGAAFGVASLAIRPALLERLVGLTGIDSVLPFAAPPLGSTARILVALALTGLGAIVGLIVARRIRRPAPVHRSERRVASVEVAQAEVAPFAAEATEDDEAEVPAPRPVLAGRRRSLMSQHETAPDVSAAIAPQILDVAEFDLASFDGPLEAPRGVLMPTTPVSFGQTDVRNPASLDNRLFAQYTHNTPADDHAVPAIADEMIAKPDTDSIDEMPAPEAAWLAHEIQSVSTPEAQAPTPATTEAERRSATALIASAPLEELSPVQLLERLAIAMERRREADGAETQAPVAAPAPLPEPEATAAQSIAAPEAPPSRLTFSPPALTPLQSVPSEPQESTPEIKAEHAVAAPFVAPMPGALRSVALEATGDDESDALPGYDRPRHIGLAVAPAWRPAAEADVEIVGETEAQDTKDAQDSGDVLEHGYSSLLNLSRPTTTDQSFVRIEDRQDNGPVATEVVFPGTEAKSEPGTGPAPSPPRLFDAPGRPGTIDTERALRDALATLQRMSGAA